MLELHYEQYKEQLVQLPFAVSAKPTWQVRQIVLDEQLKQFEGQDMQLPDEAYWPGGHLIQFVEVPLHVIQLELQDSQLLVEFRKNPT